MSQSFEKIRIGRFTILRDMIWREPEMCREILRDVIVTEAGYSMHGDHIEYTGIHPAFEEQSIEQGCIQELPIYTALLEFDGQLNRGRFTSWAKA